MDFAIVSFSTTVRIPLQLLIVLTLRNLLSVTFTGMYQENMIFTGVSSKQNRYSPMKVLNLG
jgi:hypothetical protein